jgi:hypothetical protein
MTNALSCRLFQRILLLYPEPFRREFADEMLGVFDECHLTQRASFLLVDGLVGALKQQFHNFAVPTPNRTPLYAEVPTAPGLARSLAIAAVAISFLANALVQDQTPQGAKHWVTAPTVHEVLYFGKTMPATSSHISRSTPRRSE